MAYSFDSIYAPDVVEHFKYFMQGCGFFESNIMSAMDAMVQEYEMMKEKTDAKSSLSD